MVRDLIWSFSTAFLFTLLGIAFLYYVFIRDTHVDTAEIFSDLYERCTDYVESSVDFDSKGLIEGGLRSEKTLQIDRLRGHSIWHHPKALLVVTTIDKNYLNNPINKRQCKVGLSENGKRPSITKVGLMLIEFFSIKRKRITEETHIDYVYEYPVPETFAFRSKALDQYGCATIHSLLLDSGGDNIRVHIFQEGIACSVDES